MALNDKIKDVVNNAGELRKNTSKVADDLSTKIYKGVRKFKEQFNNSFSGKDKENKELEEERAYLASMRQKLQKMGTDDIQVDTNLELDEARENFYTIDENYLDPINKEDSSKPSEYIENWLSKSDEATIFDEPAKTEKDKKQDKKEFAADKLEKGKSFAEKFDNDEFGFGEKNKIFKELGGKNSSETIARFTNINEIIQAFTGEQSSMERVDNIVNKPFVKKISDMVIDFLEGKKDAKETGNLLYMETHGIDSTKINTPFDLKKLAGLCVCQEHNIPAVECQNATQSDLDIIVEELKNGTDFNDPSIVFNAFIRNDAEKVLETKEDRIRPLTERKDLYLQYEEPKLGDEKNSKGNVAFFLQTPTKSTLLATQNELGNFVQGSRLDLMKEYESCKQISDYFNREGPGTLGHEINKQTEITHALAVENKMSAAEKAEYDKQVEEETNRLMKGNPFLNMNN